MRSRARTWARWIEVSFAGNDHGNEPEALLSAVGEAPALVQRDPGRRARRFPRSPYGCPLPGTDGAFDLAHRGRPGEHRFPGWTPRRGLRELARDQIPLRDAPPFHRRRPHLDSLRRLLHAALPACPGDSGWAL